MAATGRRGQVRGDDAKWREMILLREGKIPSGVWAGDIKYASWTSGAV